MNLEEDECQVIACESAPPSSSSSTAREPSEGDDAHITEVVVREAAIEVIDQLLAKTDYHIRNVRNKIEKLDAERTRELNKQSMNKKKVPIGLYLPPYFRNEHGRGPPLNEEAKKKRDNSDFDSLHKELKRWTDKEIRTLQGAVREEFIIHRLQTFRDRLEIVEGKIKARGQETNHDEFRAWEMEKEGLLRKIEYIKADESAITFDSSCVNWHRVSSKFKGSRSPIELKLRWQNEFSPTINNERWTPEEITKLRELVAGKIGFVNWRSVAEQIGTNRTAFAVFQKFQDEIAAHMLKEWSREEDEKLLGIIEMVKVGENIPWDKVCAYIPGRTRHQCKQRYLRALDKSIRHGRWNEEEDLLLLCAVERFGNKAWHKVCKQVPGRSDVQCKDRWNNVLSVAQTRNGQTNNWTVEEDEKLLAGIEVFGKSRWRAICDTFLPHRRPHNIRCRYFSLVTTKLRFSAAQVEVVRRTQQATLCRAALQATKKERVFQRFGELFGTEQNQAEELQKIGENSFSEMRQQFPVFISDEEAAQAAARKAEIEEMHGRPVGDDDGVDAAVRVLDMIEVTEEDALRLERSLERRRRIYGPRRVYHSLPSTQGAAPQIEGIGEMAVARKMRRPITVPRDRVIRVDSGIDDMDDEGQVQHITEAIAQLIRLHDALHFHKVTGESDALQASMQSYFKNTLRDALRDPSAEAELDSTVPPNVATFAMYSNSQAARPRLLQDASHFYELIDNNDCVPSTSKRLNIQLSKDIRDSKEYKDFKARVRCLLLEPCQFEASLLTEGNDEHWRGLKEKQRQIENEVLHSAFVAGKSIPDEPAEVDGAVEDIPFQPPAFDLHKERAENDKRVDELLNSLFAGGQNEQTVGDAEDIGPAAKKLRSQDE